MLQALAAARVVCAVFDARLLSRSSWPVKQRTEQANRFCFNASSARLAFSEQLQSFRLRYGSAIAAAFTGSRSQRLFLNRKVGAPYVAAGKDVVVEAINRLY
jgi:hypothetical protein